MKLTLKQRYDAECMRNEKLIQMVEAEREKVAGYEQLAKLHAAYIAFLLQKLGATKEAPVTITKEDAAEAMKLKVLALPGSKCVGLYVEE